MSARPVTPRPMRRLAPADFCCALRGNGEMSCTLSRKRVATAVTERRPAKSRLGCVANGFCTKRGRLIDPRLQAPDGGSGVSPHGLVVDKCSQYQRLLARLMRSMNSRPGSAL